MKINPNQLNAVRPLKPGVQTHEQQVEAARTLQKTYTDFVGKTFFSQMLKSMRSTVGKAAYFDGGQAEQAFRGQLDEQLAGSMSKASASKIADPMFQRQFPREAKLLAEVDAKKPGTLADLASLRRR